MKAKFASEALCMCGHPPQPEILAPGYGVRKNGNTCCIDCLTQEQTVRLLSDGAGTLIFDDRFNDTMPSGHCVRNEAGTLRFDVLHVKQASHNLTRARRDIYFVGPDGMRWQGAVFGDESVKAMKVRRCTGIHQLRDQLRHMGVSLYLNDGQYRVNLRHGPEVDAYYTTDPVDAFRAAERMVAERDAPKPIRMDW